MPIQLPTMALTSSVLAWHSRTLSKVAPLHAHGLSKDNFVAEQDCGLAAVEHRALVMASDLRNPCHPLLKEGASVERCRLRSRLQKPDKHGNPFRAYVDPSRLRATKASHGQEASRMAHLLVLRHQLALHWLFQCSAPCSAF